MKFLSFKPLVLFAGILAVMNPCAEAQATSTADRAKQAIRQRYNDISTEPLRENGYAAGPERNLVPGVRLEDIQADFLQGSGNELEGKFCAAHSSSALAANTFGLWRKHPEDLNLLGMSGFTSFRFERQCPTGLGGIPPNLDFLVEGPAIVIGAESKFLEILTPKKPHFAASYKPANLPQMETCWADWMEELKAGPEQYLDAAQLVRHYLGLRNQPEFKDRKIILLYVFWEPENWREFPEYRQHREELAVFESKVKKSEVTFVWMSYPQLWDQWESRGFYADPVREIRKRYLLSI